jgi:hypothetical protein
VQFGELAIAVLSSPMLAMAELWSALAMAVLWLPVTATAAL